MEVADFESCDFIAGSDDLVAFRRAGVRAAQSTPLLTRNGKLVGMITTHWTQEHQARERDLRLFDIIARQAADLIERHTAAQALREHASRLVEADRYKDEFLATLAHELRNPLAPIRTGLDLLELGNAEQSRRVLPMMGRQLNHMVRLIDDLLDVSRISRGMVTLRRDKVEMNAVIESAIETSRPLIDAGRHGFSVMLPDQAVWLDVDATRIAQVISNLLNNAAKYTPQGGQIDLLAEVLDGQVKISVRDTGIGIPAAMLAGIFELFAQVDRGNERSQSGLGVGLALARHLAEMHQGRIEVASPGANGGSVFTLYLPIVAQKPLARAGGGKQASGDSHSPAARIMIVDDNADAAEVLALLLQETGYTTRVILESTGALAAALEFRPDVMFLDIGMPQLDGFDLARHLRAHPSLRHVCLIALSGWGSTDDRCKSRNAGIDHHLTKPVEFDQVQAMVADVLKSQT